MNIYMYAKFQLHAPYGFWEEDFWIFFFKNLAFRLQWQQIKISDLDKTHMVGKGLLQEHFCETFFQNICSNTEIIANFHFFHCKSMKTLSCHSNDSM